MISSTLVALTRTATRLLAPSCCLLCRRFDYDEPTDTDITDPWLCRPCRLRLPLFSGAPWRTHHRALGFMEGGMQQLLHAYKFDGVRALVDTWVTLIASQSELVQWINGSDVITAVPMHPTKLRRRGFNPALLLAQALAQRFDRYCVDELLRKRLPTTAQSTLSRVARLRNLPALRASLCCDRTALPACSSLLLIDDVVTTGATINSCRTTLQTAFPRLPIRTLSLAVTRLQFLPASPTRHHI